MSLIKDTFFLSSVSLGLLCVGCGGGSSESEVPPLVSVIDDNTTLYQRVYDANASLNLLNPNRGLYRVVASLDEVKTYDRFQIVKDQGYQLVYAPLKLYHFIKDENLSQELLETLDTNLQEAREAHVRLITRIQYRENNATDPDKEIILSHLKQLAPLFQKYNDIISVVEAGCIGAYGEWHTFGEDFVDTNPEYKQNRKDIVLGLQKVFPNKFILLRTPMHKELLFGASQEYRDVASEAEITPDIAYSDDIRARISHHNDCFLASDTDLGTYASDNIEFWKSYVANDARYAPLGGESCLDESAYTECSNAQNELQKMGWSFLNSGYYPDVIERWKREGCFDTIAQNLGYHFVLKNASVRINSVQADIDFSIENKGYSSAFENYNVSFSLYNAQHSYIFDMPEIDVRKWGASQEQKLHIVLDIDAVAEGEYTLGMQIQHDTFFIRFADNGTWDDARHINTLFTNIKITREEQ